MAIIMCAALTVTWFGLGRHIVHVWPGRPLAVLICLAYPALDIWPLTERQVIGDPEGVACKMHELRALGVLVALDEFGVGRCWATCSGCRSAC